MDAKQRDAEEHRRYLQVLRSMIPQQRLEKALELAAIEKQAFRDRLREQFPLMNEEQFHQLFIERWINRPRVD